LHDSVPDFKIIKIFNNNVILVNHENKEKIILGKGIGFGKHQGDTIENSPKLNKVFSLEDDGNSNKFKELITKVDNRTIGICEEIIYMLSRELNEELDEKIHISLIDHIAFTLYRLQQKDEIQNPFLIETETLYKSEFELAKKAVAMLEKETGISIPEGETGFITLHIHSARNRGKLSNTIKYAYLSNSIVEMIEDELNIAIDRRSLDYARFVTHIRFAIERIINSSPIKNDLLGAIKKQFKSSYKLSKKVAELIENELGIRVVEDEVGYIAMHIEKLKSAV
jgi:transcriptional antiterminator